MVCTDACVHVQIAYGIFAGLLSFIVINIGSAVIGQRCVRARVRACVRACACVCVRACVHMRVSVCLCARLLKLQTVRRPPSKLLKASLTF